MRSWRDCTPSRKGVGYIVGKRKFRATITGIQMIKDTGGGD